MIQNRFHKTALGVFSQLVIAKTADVEETNASGGTPSIATVPVTVGASPTQNDTINFNVDGVDFGYTVPASATTQSVVTAITAMLNGNGLGFTVDSNGTTSANFIFSGAVSFNGKAITLTETGSTFTTAGPYTFAGGVAPDAAASDTIEAFQANSNAGTVWAFWADTNTNLVTGDTKNPANAKRSFYLAWKGADGLMKKTSPVPVSNVEITKVAYASGTALSKKIVYGGTYTAGQYIHARVVDTTPTNFPYASYEFSVKSTGTINTDVAALAAKINADKDNKFVTASASTNELTLVATAKNLAFDVFGSLEPLVGTDQSSITTALVAARVLEIGSLSYINELYRYYVTNQGGIEYSPEGTKPSEINNIAAPDQTVANWGLVLIKATSSEKGATREYRGDVSILVALQNGEEAKLALI